MLRVREGVITLEQLYFADEIRPVDEIKPKKSKVDRRELDMAEPAAAAARGIGAISATAPTSTAARDQRTVIGTRSSARTATA